MEVLNTRAALLSNYEVLSLLRELESDHLARARTALRVKKEEEHLGPSDRSHSSGTTFGEPSENLRTVEIEAMQYLSSDFLPTTRQTPGTITQLVKDLEPYDLTKAEKLQVVNLAPVLPVELYVIIEELEDRLGDGMDDILTKVQSSLTPTSSQPVSPPKPYPTLGHPGGVLASDGQPVYMEEDDLFHEDIVFDDTGEGVGVEGDLDMEED